MSAPRRFDHAEAYARWLAGETQIAIAASCGVTPSAVGQVIARMNPVRREAMNKYGREYQRDRLCKPCVRGCGRTAWHGTDREGVCIPCRAAERTTSVRDTELRCSDCGEWKPDDDFPHGRGRTGVRRGRHPLCRVCQTRARQDYRERHKIPCDQCGKPRLPHSEKNGGARRALIRDSGLCKPCYVASITKAAA